METTRHNLLGLTRDELNDFVLSIGEPHYRGGQIFQWLYAKRRTDFQSMTDLGKAFRARLETTATIRGLNLVTAQESRRDGTTKLLFALSDGSNIESVLIPPAAALEEDQQRLTLCISTQVGCPLDCKFCATATMGFTRNLTVGELIDQVLSAQRASRKRITNIVFMGMGEPLMNYANVMKAVEIITGGIGIAARRLTISTAGRADKIRQMGEERQKAKLAISLHSVVDKTRTMLMPINKKFDIETLGSAIAHYYAATKQRVTYEYIFFDGINDTDLEVARLIKFARRVPCKINVIPFHSITFTGPTGIAASLRPSPRSQEIVTRLRAHDLTVMVRGNAGDDIEAACGQLAVNADRRKRRLGSFDSIPSYTLQSESTPG